MRLNYFFIVKGGQILTSLEISALRNYLSDKVAVEFLNKLCESKKRQRTLEEVQHSLRRIGLVLYADELQKNLELGIPACSCYCELLF